MSRPGFLLAVLLLASAHASAQVFSDPGFTSEVVVTLPSFRPVGLAFAPGGRMFVWQEDGIVRVVKDGALLPTPFINLSPRVNVVNDRGMLGLAVAPAFASNGYVYLLYTYENQGNPNDAGPKTARLTRVTADPANRDVALPGSEVVLLGSIGTPPCGNFPATADCIGAEGDSHTIGTLRFAPDGTLFVSSGDGAAYNTTDVLALRSQNLDSLNGKLLRIKPDGTAPTDNPFYNGNPNSNRSKVYAYGLRNPFRFALHPTTGEPYIGEVGWNTWEEQNTGRGANFGWPCFEGNGPQSAYQSRFAQCRALPQSATVAPLYTYSHGEGNSAIGGTFYAATQFPPPYRGSYFFADYGGGWLRRMVFAPDGHVSSVQPFATDLQGPVALETGPEGALYYVSLPTGQVRRIRYVAGPTAVATASPTSGSSPLTVAFSSSGSSDPQGSALTYFWDFGDGTTSSAPNPSHTYTSATPHAFTARLTVTNAQGATASASIQITVGGSPPVATITAPEDGAIYPPGTVVGYSGTGSDPDEALPDSALHWEVLLHHNDHIHPYATSTGPSGSFLVTDHGEGTFYYELLLTVTDSSGLTGTDRVIVRPSSAQETYLSDLAWTQASNGWGPVERDESNGELGAGDGQLLTLNGVTYAKGLGVHADSTVVYALGAAYTTFLAEVGVDDEVGGQGSVVFEVWVDGVKAYDSGLMTGGTPTRTVSVDVTGKQQLRLTVRPTGDGNAYDHADWARARLTGGGTGPLEVFLSDLPWTSAGNGWGPVERDMSNGESGAGDGQAIRLGGVAFAKGLGVHAGSDVRYSLGGDYTAFHAQVGVDDEVGNRGSVVFQVFADGARVYDSGIMTGSTATKAVDLDVMGVQELRLVVTTAGDNANYDHADWAGARLSR